VSITTCVLMNDAAAAALRCIQGHGRNTGRESTKLNSEIILARTSLDLLPTVSVNAVTRNLYRGVFSAVISVFFPSFSFPLPSSPSPLSFLRLYPMPLLVTSNTNLFPYCIFSKLSRSIGQIFAFDMEYLSLRHSFGMNP